MNPRYHLTSWTLRQPPQLLKAGVSHSKKKKAARRATPQCEHCLRNLTKTRDQYGFVVRGAFECRNRNCSPQIGGY